MIDYILEYVWQIGFALLFIFFSLWLYFWELPRFGAAREYVPIFASSEEVKDLSYPEITGLLAMFDENGKVTPSKIHRLKSYATGLEALITSWPFALFIGIVAASTGYFIRGIVDEKRYQRQLACVEFVGKLELNTSVEISKQTSTTEYLSHLRMREANQIKWQANAKLLAMQKYLQAAEAKAHENLKTLENRSAHQQQDYLKRGQMIDRLKEEKIDLKLENLGLKKENLKLTQENIKLMGIHLLPEKC